MKKSSLPEDVQAFLMDYIHSIEQLEILLLLKKSPERSWTPAEVSQELRSAPQSAALRLTGLKGMGLIESGSQGADHYQYSGGTHPLDAIITKLAQYYQVHRYTIIDLIFSKPADALNTFSNAFLFKKDKPDG